MGPTLKAERGPGDARLGRRASSLFYCRTAHSYIVLDLQQDRYRTLPADPIDATGGPTVHPLLAEAVASPECPPPSESWFQAGCRVRRDHRVGLREILRFVSCTLGTERRLRPGQFTTNVALFAQRKRKHAAAHATFDFDRARAQVAVFDTLRPWWPQNYRCLYDSLALLVFLAASDLFPTWVFGVQEEPFEAHCWVQAGEVVLNDSLESVSAFTPIMIV